MPVMNELQDKNILLGVCGGIAAYKSAILARRLIDAGATVRVVMTASAQSFVQPMTFQALTGNPVHTQLLDADAEAAMGHIELARWADLILIAPASANTLARISHGLADDLLSTLCLATEAPLFIAPAMNRLMWSHPATTHNCQSLRSRGARFIGPAAGSQACGETGAGRLVEPEQIRDQLIDMLAGTATQHSRQDRDSPIDSPMRGKRVLITAGPTQEAIDPVRYISNHSSGKMGFAIAEAAVSLGAEVTLIAGPVSLQASEAIQRIDVVSARDMHAAVMQAAPQNDVFISVAAVADYRMDVVQTQKIKKHDEHMQLSLVKNPDILKDVATLQNKPFCVGFAAETQNVEANAREKLARKNLDMIAANHVGQSDKPVFGSDANALDVYWPDNNGHQAIPSAHKSDIARSLLAIIGQRLKLKTDNA